MRCKSFLSCNTGGAISHKRDRAAVLFSVLKTSGVSGHTGKGENRKGWIFMTLEELYESLLQGAARGDAPPHSVPHAEPNHLDRLLHPQNYAPVWVTADCAHCQEGDADCAAACTAACLFHAIHRQTDGKIAIDPARCSGCAACLRACKSGTLTASRDILPTLYAVKHAKGPVYALIAPSFHGQFTEAVTSGKLRSAFQALGFTDLVEVALFADILTLKEALEFDRNVHDRQDFQLTSCCCPVWISLIRNIYSQLMPHVPGAVSPMIAAGRTVKALHPDALTVFIGPCLAKKVEAREPDLQGAVDWVLTFQELLDIFEAADIHPETLPDAVQDHSSRAGRLYGRAGGVGEAVSSAVRALHPDRAVPVTVRCADGVRDCKAMIEQLQSGSGGANFYEGMGCVGGCVGGPCAILKQQDGRENVDQYSDQAAFRTPLDNPYVPELLRRLGFETVEDFLNRSQIYTRDF
jgi:iron only hydrogenase large subunit-like protein